MEMKITFPGGSRVQAETGEFTIETDQPVRRGGTGTAPAPFDLFLASLGTCAGFFVNKFLEQRKLSTEGVQLVLRTTRDPETHMVSQVDFEVALPAGFPEKYERAIAHAIDLCSVKKHLLEPPAFTTTLVRSA